MTRLTLKHSAKICIVWSIGVYRGLLSPILGPNCRFEPSCSHYAQLSVERFGVWRGLFYAALRIGRCHPFHEGGFDPVPSGKGNHETGPGGLR